MSVTTQELTQPDRDEIEHRAHALVVDRPEHRHAACVGDHARPTDQATEHAALASACLMMLNLDEALNK